MNRQRRQIDLTGRDAVGGLAHPAQRADNNEVHADVDERDGGEEDSSERNEQVAEAVVGQLDRQRHGNGDDLRSDDLVLMPAEAVLGSIALDQSFGGHARAAVAGQASLLSSDGPRKVECGAYGAVAFADYLFIARIVAEVIDDVGFPVRRAISEV